MQTDATQSVESSLPEIDKGNSPSEPNGETQHPSDSKGINKFSENKKRNLFLFAMARKGRMKSNVTIHILHGSVNTRKGYNEIIINKDVQVSKVGKLLRVMRSLMRVVLKVAHLRSTNKRGGRIN